MNQTIGQMDEATQQNAALVEKLAAAAASMQQQALLLANVVAVFELQLAAVPLTHSTLVRPAPVVRHLVRPAAVAPLPDRRVLIRILLRRSSARRVQSCWAVTSGKSFNAHDRQSTESLSF